MASDQKVIVFSDIHITEIGETIINLDPLVRFQQGLEHALQRHPDCDLVVLTGDLAHHGTTSQYQRLRSVLDGCPVPVSLLLGNHDRRANFVKIFPQAPRTQQGHLQSVVDLGNTRLIMLDTLDEQAPDHHSGWLCPARLDWMEAAIAQAEGRQVVLFTHHPLFETGFAGMDAIGLRNRKDLRQRLSHHPNLAHVISGHIHRTLVGVTDGITSMVLKSTCHQMPMLLGQEGSGHSVDEPGAYGILLLRPNGIVMHSEDFALANVAPQEF